MKFTENFYSESLKKKQRIPTGAQIEQDARIQKLEDSCLQQCELHTEKLKAVEKEIEYWDNMNKAAVLKSKVYKSELKAMQFQAN